MENLKYTLDIKDGVTEKNLRVTVSSVWSDMYQRFETVVYGPSIDNVIVIESDTEDQAKETHEKVINALNTGKFTLDHIVWTLKLEDLDAC